MKNTQHMHVIYHEILGLFLRRFGEDCVAYDLNTQEDLLPDELRALHERAVKWAYTASNHGSRWKGGAYITESRPCYIKFGEMFAVCVTMECSCPDLLPTLCMYWLVDQPPVDLM